MDLVPLKTCHLASLYQFELENRQWFESLIASRGDDFYSKESVADHIELCLSEVAQGQAFYGVLVINNTIVARANIRNVCHLKSNCFVGYRVAKQHLGKGYASYCLRQLCKIASNKGIRFIEAKVLDNNPASKTVLLRQGFKPLTVIDNFIEHNGRLLACTNYRKE